MNIFNKIYCRIYQWVFKIAMPLLPYRKPETIDSVLDIKNILKMNYLKSALIVTDSGIRNLGLIDDLEHDECVDDRYAQIVYKVDRCDIEGYNCHYRHK